MFQAAADVELPESLAGRVAYISASRPARGGPAGRRPAGRLVARGFSRLGAAIGTAVTVLAVLALVGLGLSAWFFVSPVMYPLSFVHNLAERWPWLESLYQLNPLTVIITAYRSLQTGAPLVLTPAAMIGWLWPLAAAVLVFYAFDRAQRNFADVL